MGRNRSNRHRTEPTSDRDPWLAAPKICLRKPHGHGLLIRKYNARDMSNGCISRFIANSSVMFFEALTSRPWFFLISLLKLRPHYHPIWSPCLHSFASFYSAKSDRLSRQLKAAETDVNLDFKGSHYRFPTTAPSSLSLTLVVDDPGNLVHRIMKRSISRSQRFKP